MPATTRSFAVTKRFLRNFPNQPVTPSTLAHYVLDRDDGVQQGTYFNRKGDFFHEFQILGFSVAGPESIGRTAAATRHAPSHSTAPLSPQTPRAREDL